MSNEPADGPLITRYPDARAAAVRIGYTDDDAFQRHPPTPSMVATLPGCFALVSADDAGATGFTAVHRIEPLYVAEGRDVLVLSNSARAAHAAAQLPEGRPPLIALIGLTGPGFMISDETPFPGVRAVPADSAIRLTARGIEIRDLPAPDVNRESTLDEVTDSLLGALVAATETLARVPGRRTVHLTGGKDSRLTATVLAEAGVDFATATTGVPSHPDVTLAHRVASLLGVPHETTPPVGTVGDGQTVEVWPERRAHSVLRGCEGMLSAYETIGLSGTYRDESVSLGGHGGELLRGGYAYGIPPASTERVVQRLSWALEPHRDLLSEQARVQLDDVAAPWRQQMAEDPHVASERVYRVLRTGRWHAVAHSVYSIRGPRRSLLADNRVVRIVSAAPQDLAAQERIVHTVIHRLRPDVCAVPLYPKRWNFEKTEPAPDCHPATWADRKTPAVDKQQAWNWRVSYPTDLHTYFTEAILDAPLFDRLLDRPRVETFLTETRDTRTGAQAARVWHLYTASRLEAGLGSSPVPPEGPVFTIPIPKA